MFFKIESWNFQVQFEIEFHETSLNFNSFSLFRQLLFSSFFIGCLIELKFCKVSWNSISNWTWKFQLSILKNKKVLLLKEFFFRPLSISKQKSFVYWLNFPEGFDTDIKWKLHFNSELRMIRIIPILRVGIAIVFLFFAVSFIKDAIKSWNASPSVTSGRKNLWTTVNFEYWISLTYS